MAEAWEQEPRPSLRDDENEVDFFVQTLASSPAYVLRLDAHNRVRYINRVRPGARLTDILGANILDLLSPEERALGQRTVDEVRTTGEARTVRSQRRGPDGTITYYDAIVTPVRERDGSLGLPIFTLDVSLLVKHAVDLETSQAKLEMAAGGAHMGLAEWDLETNELSWNEQMRFITGEDEPLDGQDFVDTLVHPDDAEPLRRGLAKMRVGPMEATEYRIVRRDGDVRWVRSTGHIQGREGRPGRMLIALVDVTASRTAYEQARRAQRLESVGTLTAGVAHNFNNLLTIILPTLEELEDRLDDEGRSILADAQDAGKRAKELVRQLMAFARNAPSRQSERIRIDTLLLEAVRLCRRTFHKLRFETDIQSPLWVEGHGSDLQQLFLNLLINAADALQGRPDGRVEVRAQSSVGTIRVDVQDNGGGMSDAVASRIFEPFFTTKGAKGTGLGLASCQGIAEDHGAKLSCRSAPGRGSTFSVILYAAPRGGKEGP